MAESEECKKIRLETLKALRVNNCLISGEPIGESYMVFAINGTSFKEFPDHPIIQSIRTYLGEAS